MTDAEKAEKLGYARGYAAGRAKMKKDGDAEREQAKRQAFLEHAFLAALPACIVADGWTTNGKPTTGTGQRTELAWDFAEQALKSRRIAK